MRKARGLPRFSIRTTWRCPHPCQETTGTAGICSVSSHELQFHILDDIFRPYPKRGLSREIVLRSSSRQAYPRRAAILWPLNTRAPPDLLRRCSFRCESEHQCLRWKPYFSSFLSSRFMTTAAAATTAPMAPRATTAPTLLVSPVFTTPEPPFLTVAGLFTTGLAGAL